MVEPVYDREGVVFATLDRGRIAEKAMALDPSGHYSRANCLGLQRFGSRHRNLPESQGTEEET